MQLTIIKFETFKHTVLIFKHTVNLIIVSNIMLTSGGPGRMGQRGRAGATGYTGRRGKQKYFMVIN